MKRAIRYKQPYISSKKLTKKTHAHQVKRLVSQLEFKNLEPLESFSVANLEMKVNTSKELYTL